MIRLEERSMKITQQRVFASMIFFYWVKLVLKNLNIFLTYISKDSEEKNFFFFFSVENIFKYLKLEINLLFYKIIQNNLILFLASEYSTYFELTFSSHFGGKWEGLHVINLEKPISLLQKYNDAIKVWQNLTIPSQKASGCLFLSSSDLKSHSEERLDLVDQNFVMQIFEFTKSLNLATN